MTATRVLYLGGLGRSGSTLAELVLAQSPDVCAVGETVHLWDRALVNDERCGCGTRFSGCPFWRHVGERAFGGWSAVDLSEIRALRAAVDRTRHVPRLARATLPSALHTQVRHYTSYYSRIYRAACEVSGAEVVVDSSKHASLAYALRWDGDLDLRVLHLVRDSRGVAHSWGRQRRRPEVVNGEAFMPRISPAMVSALWTLQNAAFDLLARRTPVTRLRYEDFVAQPHATLRRLRALADLPDLPADAPVWQVLDDPATVPRPAHTVAGNPLRFAAGPLRITADDAWRTALPYRRRAMVSALTFPLRLRYGYHR